ncbi:MAG TPA: carbamoyltransferase N-terminal domain-containing protein [Planctomycetota bacterium]|nr:carbamoyltransferase N-terminal domain-containing protein [Planctomycetota bacterium]
MNVLGVSAWYHDAAAALVRDGDVVAAAQEERFSRRKNDPSFPAAAARFCLRHAGLRPSDLDAVVFYEKPFRRFERILVTQLRAFPRSAKAFSRAMFDWLGGKLWMKTRIADALDVPASRVLFCEHHESHAASAFFPSGFDDAAVLTVDGVGEWTTTAAWRGRGAALEPLTETRFPHSLGLMYSAVTAFLGFEVNDGEQKVMALAALGEPRYRDACESLLRFLPDGGFELDASAFRFAWDPDRSFGRRLVELFGEPRAPGGPLLATGADRRHADVAASVQATLEDALIRLARDLHARAPSENLCLAGGVALNIPANARLLRDGPFKRLFVQPSPGDSGGALGAALYGHAALTGERPRYVQRHAFLGEPLRDDPRPGARELPDDDAVVDETSRLLAEGRTVGFVQGRFEWGPRALGRRSLLASPRDPAMKERINGVIKRRESFRPFAPAAPAERAAEYFAIPPGGESPARYMLVVGDATDRGRAAAPAALHVDGTARAQVVDRDVDPLFHAVLERFGERTGDPVLLNTSLNLRGEPIVRGEADAHAVWTRSALDALVAGRRLYVRD